MNKKSNLRRLLPYGGVSLIAKQLGMSAGATSTAIQRGNPGHPAVQAALKLAQESGALAAAQALASLSPASSTDAN